MRTTKIVATLGPACQSGDALRKLVQAGANVIRLNASHASPDAIKECIREIRAVTEELEKPAGILLDLQGPKIRLGKFENGSVRLEKGAHFVITVESVLGNSERASTGYPDLARDVKAGDSIILADGAVQLRVLSSDGVSALCEVTVGGVIGDNKGINLPGVNVRAPSLTKKDMVALQAGLDAGIDFVALSFVRRPSDLVRLKLFLEERDATVPVIAKIEKLEAWENLDAVLAETDGVMVARGDLGVETALEKVPFIQKTIIDRARHLGKFSITATQMLESMIERPTPTRAEVSDVANAIYDGTDAVMLSAETSVGKYPFEAVRMMGRIAEETESCRGTDAYPELPSTAKEPTHAQIVARAAYRAARSAGVEALAVFTATGFTAMLIASYRPPVPIFAFTTAPEVTRRLSLIYGVHPVLVPAVSSTDQMLIQVDRVLLELGLMKLGDDVVFVAGQPVGRAGTTNLMKLHRVGELR